LSLPAWLRHRWPHHVILYIPQALSLASQSLSPENLLFLFVFHHFSPGLFHSVPVSLAASPMAPPGRLWLSHLLPAKKAQGQKTETALRDFCNVLYTMFYNVLQCFIMFLHLQYLSILHHPIAEVY
jgi:hypothetical protein